MNSSDKRDANGLAYLDVAEGMDRIGNNTALYCRLLDAFEKDTSWQKLCEALDAGNLAAGAGAAHAIKGMCANLSMKALAGAAAELEAALKAGVNDDSLREKARASREETLEAASQAKNRLA